MSDRSAIEWTDASWNPVRGCTKVSPGCTHCYAETIAERFRGVAGHPYEHGFDLRLVPNKLPEPLRWQKSRMVFVNSMSDLFHQDVPTDYIARVAQVMRMANWHAFQVLTKRADRLRDLLAGPLLSAAQQPHIWWGVSVETGATGCHASKPYARARRPCDSFPLSRSSRTWALLISRAFTGSLSAGRADPAPVR